MKELKGGTYRPVYLLMGDEPYFIDCVSDYIEEHALSEDEKVFNQTVFYGNDTDAVTVVHEASQYPSMAQRRLVMVKEAQSLDKIALLESYLNKPQDTTVLVICHKYKTLDKRLKLTKSIDKIGVIMESKKIYDNQLPAWIRNYSLSLGLAIEDKAIALLAESIGTNLRNIASAFEKMQLAADGKLTTITADFVADNVGISKEYNTFELRDAIFEHNVPKVNRIIKAFRQNEKQYPIQLVIATLIAPFEKLLMYHYLPDKSQAASELGEYPRNIQKYAIAARYYTGAKCANVINLLRTYDMRSKGYAWPQTTSGDLMMELVYRIMN